MRTQTWMDFEYPSRKIMGKIKGSDRKMLKRYNKGISRLSKILNDIAAIALFIMMVLVISNIIFRSFGNPIQATFDYVGFLLAFGVGLGLAYCAVQDGHITINLLIEKFPVKVQKVIDILISTIVIVFLFLITWNMIKYGHTMSLRGEITATTKTPHAPFIYMVAVGLGIFSLVELGKLLKLFKKGGSSK